MDKRVLKTKSALLDTLALLLKTTDIDDITVSSLCEKANINRATFYRHYGIPMDVITEAIEDIVRQTVILSENEYADGVYTTLYNTCVFWADNRHLLQIIIQDSARIKYHVFSKLAAKINQSYSMNWETGFIAGGVANMVIQWVLSDCRQTPETLAEEMVSLISLVQSTPLSQH